MCFPDAMPGLAASGAVPADTAIISQVTVGVVAVALGIEPAKILSSSRRAPAVYARHVAMYFLHTIFQMKHRDIGEALGRDRSTAAYACRVIEERRDESWLDSLLDCLERAIDIRREADGGWGGR